MDSAYNLPQTTCMSSRRFLSSLCDTSSITSDPPRHYFLLLHGIVALFLRDLLTYRLVAMSRGCDGMYRVQNAEYFILPSHTIPIPFPLLHHSATEGSPRNLMVISTNTAPSILLQYVAAVAPSLAVCPTTHYSSLVAGIDIAYHIVALLRAVDSKIG